MRALIIDDDDIARELMGSVLRDGGHETFDLPSPIGATNIIFRERIDAIVLDVMMPQMSGENLARLLRSNPRLSRLMIVLVSSCPREDLDKLATQVRADGVVPKHELRASLLNVVENAFARATATKPSFGKIRGAS